MAAPVAGQGTEQALALDHLPRPTITVTVDSSSPVAQVDLAAGIVQDDDEVVPVLVLEPAAMAAVDRQQHTR
jgi:hypothetical protein